jgi:hypothetical protein
MIAELAELRNPLGENFRAEQAKLVDTRWRSAEF